jgi:hypothetical protein
MNTTVHNNQNSVLSASTASVTITSGGSGFFGRGHNTTVGYAAASPIAVGNRGAQSGIWASPNKIVGDTKFTDDVVFEGDINWKGRDLGQLIESIEDRLAILVAPTPEKLQKFAALKKAYDHYKLMERLIDEDD